MSTATQTGDGRSNGSWSAPRGSKPPVKRANLRRILAAFAPYRFGLAAIVVSVIASAQLGLLPSFYLQTIINQGLAAGNLHVVTHYSVLALVAIAASTGFALAYGCLNSLVGLRVVRDFRRQLFSHVQSLSLSFFTDTRTGEIQSRLSNDVGGIQSVVTDSAANVVQNLTTVVSTLIAMFIMDWRLALMSVGVLPIFVVLGARIGSHSRGFRTVVQKQYGEIASTMQEMLSVSGMLLTKTSGRQEMARQRFERDNENLTLAQIRLTLLYKIFYGLIGLVFNVAPALVYWLAGYLVIRHVGPPMSIGTIVAFTALQARLFFPLTTLLSTQVDISSAMALFERIYEYLDMEPEIADAPDALRIDVGDVKGAVAFEDVTFSYAATQERPTLSGVTFEARAGELVALVGHSGAGKTTLTYLIPRLYDPSSGRVMLDGIDVRKIALQSLAEAIAVVTQETYLLHDTIRENLRYGRPDATDAELHEAARVAGIHDHIASLPDGYDTVVGERGYKLSGGEKQRISIARAVLKNPRILILDEATSALDTHSERIVQAALEPLMRGRTTIAIAHRLSTILAADRIVVMDAGRVVEQGTHRELLARDGHYANLYRLQFQYGHSSEPEQAAAA